MKKAYYASVGLEWHLPVCVHCLGWHSEQPPIHRPSGYNLPQIFFCTDGCGELFCGERHYIIDKNTFFYLPAFLPHSYQPITPQWSVQWLAFGGEFHETVMRNLDFHQEIVLKNNHLEDYFSDIYNLMLEDSLESRVRASGILYKYLTEQSYQLHCKIQVKPYQNKLDQVVEYINLHFAEEISLQTLSEAAHLTPEYLCTIFKEQYQMRPFQYITRKRIQQAKNLLSTKEYSVSEVSEQVGFHSVSYFCKLFKQYENMTPKEFMNQ